MPTMPSLDEMALAGPEHLDARYVEGYDRKARIDPTDDLETLIVRGLNADSTLVDLGAGTGTFALAAAAHCRRVIAVDVSPAMLAVARSKAAEAGMSNVECVHAGFLSYEHSGAPPDFVYTRNALHHLPDFWKAIALRRIAELLPVGGVLYLRDLVFTFDLTEAKECISLWLDTGQESSEEGWTRREFEAHLRDEYSTFNWLLEPMIEQAGLQIDQTCQAGIRVYAAYVCTKRRG